MTPTIDQNRLAQFTSGARTLAVGGHSSPHDDLCLLEATAFVAGVPHSDHPACVSPSIAALGRRDHATVLHGIRLADARVRADAETAAVLLRDYYHRMEMSL